MSKVQANPIQVGDLVQIRPFGRKLYEPFTFIGSVEHAAAAKKLINRAILEGVVADQYRVLRHGKQVYPK